MANEPGAAQNEEFEPSPDGLANESPQQEQPLGIEADGSVKAAIDRLWDVVKTGADIIVTLRQENTMLSSQMSSLRKSESALQAQVEEFLGRIADLENAPATAEAPGESTDRLEDRISTLEAELTAAREELNETSSTLTETQAELEEKRAHLEDQAEISQQIVQLRAELESRTQLLAELQEDFENRHVTLEPDEERDRLQAELDRSLQIIERYRAAGLRHLEDPTTEDQTTLFNISEVETSGMSIEELRALADRLDGVAKRLDDLFGLS